MNYLGRKLDGGYEFGTDNKEWDKRFGFQFDATIFSSNKFNKFFSLSHPLKKGECVKIKGKIKIELA